MCPLQVVVFDPRCFRCDLFPFYAAAQLGIAINGGRGILSHKTQLPNATPEVTKMRIWVSHKAQHTPGSEKAQF